MGVKAIRALVWTELKLVFREPMAVFFSVAFPTGMLLLFGSMYGNRPVPMFGGRGTVDVSVPAYTALVIATGGVTGVIGTLAAYREKGVLRRLAATPVRPVAILSAVVAGILATTLAGVGALVVVGIGVFGLHVPGNPVPFLGAFALSSVTIYSLGFAVGGVLTTVRTAQAASGAIFFPMIFLSGATLPRELLPAGVRRVAQVLPLSHAVSLLRGTWTGDGFAAHAGSAVVLLGFAVAAAIVVARTFRWE